MPKTTTARFHRHVSASVLRQLARLATRRAHPPPEPSDLFDQVWVEDEELSLFTDWDFLWCRGRGVYAQDDAECRSRRVDLRGPLDGDPGPLPMEEAPEDITAKHLVLHPPSPPGM